MKIFYFSILLLLVSCKGQNEQNRHTVENKLGELANMMSFSINPIYKKDTTFKIESEFQLITDIFEKKAPKSYELKSKREINKFSLYSDKAKKTIHLQFNFQDEISDYTLKFKEANSLLKLKFVAYSKVQLLHIICADKSCENMRLCFPQKNFLFQEGSSEAVETLTCALAFEFKASAASEPLAAAEPNQAEDRTKYYLTKMIYADRDPNNSVSKDALLQTNCTAAEDSKKELCYNY